MPKKFIGENSKAVEARLRKAAVKQAEIQKKQKEAEDKLWEDDDKKLAKKLQRKNEMELKKEKQLQKKVELNALLEFENASIKTNTKPVPCPKITRAQIQYEEEKRKKEQGKLDETKIVTHLDAPLEENINRLTIEGESARNIDEAIQILNDKNTIEDKHPEKRVKAAYLAFEEAKLPILKQQNPTLRLSQIKQMLRKEWMKSPENPINQKLMQS